jgi:hypothetical protein
MLTFATILRKKGASMSTVTFDTRCELVGVWARHQASKDNLLVLSADQITVGTVPRRRLGDVCEQLEGGASVDDVLGAQADSIPLVSVRSIDAPLNRNELVIDYTLGSRRFRTRRVSVANRETQAEVLEAVQEKLGAGANVVRSVGNRWFYAFKTFNLFMVFVMTACGFDYVAVNAFAVRGAEAPQQPMMSRDELSQRAARERAKARLLNRVLRGAPKSPYVAIGIAASVAVVGVLLATLGYALTMTIFAGAAGCMLLVTGVRLIRPPVTISVFANERR